MPEGKKCPGRFNLKFNLNDPAQKAAAEILEQQGRKNISRYIAAALVKTEPESPAPAQKRKRGRPPGSKNAKKPIETEPVGTNPLRQANSTPVSLPPDATKNPALGEDTMLAAMLNFG